MKLHDLTPGQRFSFIGKHRGKVFEITDKSPAGIDYRDVATGQIRSTYSNRKTFRMEVWPETEDRVVTLSDREVELLSRALHDRYTFMCEAGYTEQDKSEINQLHLKLTGNPGRPVVLPEGPDFPVFPPDRKGDRS